MVVLIEENAFVRSDKMILKLGAFILSDKHLFHTGAFQGSDDILHNRTTLDRQTGFEDGARCGGEALGIATGKDERYG